MRITVTITQEHIDAHDPVSDDEQEMFPFTLAVRDLFPKAYIHSDHFATIDDDEVIDISIEDRNVFNRFNYLAGKRDRKFPFEVPYDFTFEVSSRLLQRMFPGKDLVSLVNGSKNCRVHE
jgi:hypothetical protein